MTVNDPEYSPDPYAHASRHLDEAEEWLTQRGGPRESVANALIGIGWALLAIARRR